jgi:hypothetical protein
MRLLTILLFFNFKVTAQATFSKTIFQGGYVVVPNNELWELNEVYVSGGGAYNFKVSNSNFKPHYKSGDTLRAPFYLPEMNFLDKNATPQYLFTINKISPP